MLPRKHTIEGAHLGKKWGVNIHELAYLILKHDITVLHPSQIPTVKFFFNPKDYRIDTATLLRIIQNEPTSLFQKMLWLPEIERLPIEKDISFIKSKSSGSKGSKKTPEEPSGPMGRYRLRDEKESTESVPDPQDGEDDPNRKIKGVIEDLDNDIKQHSNVFSLIGKVWFVKFKNKEWGLYPDQKKYKYIAYILKQTNYSPRSEDLEFSIYNEELVAKVQKKDTEEIFQDVKAHDLNISDFTDDITATDFSKFRDIGYELLEKLNEAKNSSDLKGIDEAETNFNSYRLHLSNEYGISVTISEDSQKITFKKYYRSNPENEKFRNLIKNHISNAIKDFNNQMPMLQMHLKRSLFTRSVKSTYSPETHISWHISV